MSEQNVTPSDPNTPTTPNGPQWGSDPNDPNGVDPTNPNDPRWGGQAGTSGDMDPNIDPTTGIPTPNEGPGYQGSRNPQPGGGRGGNLNADANEPNNSNDPNDPNARSAGGTDMDAGVDDDSSGYGGPVTPGDQDDVSGASRDSFPASDSPAYNPGRP